MNKNIESIHFQIYYGYNQKGLVNEKARFNDFVKGINKIIDQNGYVSIELEGSASTVPTQTFKTNHNLAQQRTNDARELLKESMQSTGIDLGKFKIVSENSIVQGPKYQADFSNTKKYKKFQYIKIIAF